MICYLFAHFFTEFLKRSFFFESFKNYCPSHTHIYDLWSMVCVLWSVVSDLWYMIYSFWFMVSGLCYIYTYNIFFKYSAFAKQYINVRNNYLRISVS